MSTEDLVLTEKVQQAVYENGNDIPILAPRILHTTIPVYGEFVLTLPPGADKDLDSASATESCSGLLVLCAIPVRSEYSCSLRKIDMVKAVDDR